MSVGVVLVSFLTVFTAGMPARVGLAVPIARPRLWTPSVLAGSTAASVALVAVAVEVSSGLHLLPRGELEVVVAGLFLAGAGLLLRQHGRRPVETTVGDVASAPRALLSSFQIALLAESADLTLILVVDLAARYHSALAVETGALAALCSVATIGVVGQHVHLPVPSRLLTWTSVAIVVLLAALTAADALRL